MTPNAIQALLDVSASLTRALTDEDPGRAVLDGLLRLWPCDAAVLLKLTPEGLVPIAVKGLRRHALGLRLDPKTQPQIQAILASDHPIRFAPDDPRENPWTGLLRVEDEAGPGGEAKPMAGIAARLTVDREPVGVLMLQCSDLEAFGKVNLEVFDIFASMAALALQTSALVDSLHEAARHGQQLARQLVSDALTQHGGTLVGDSPQMQKLREEIGIVARSDLSVLITGETGTGKELIARMIHARSGRADKPLVYLNCAALPESIAESELFGHVKGAFTGAVQNRAGKLELAHEGTLFLDEIGELPMSIQPKLLRALQFGEIQRVGSDRERRVDVRIIAATNRDLDAEVSAGRFRPDLLHRLSVYPIHAAPLRERKVDISLLASHFLDRTRARLGTPALRLEPTAIEALCHYDWPGNARELEHMLLRAALRTCADPRRVPEHGPVHIPAAVFDLPVPMNAAGEPIVLGNAPCALRGECPGLAVPGCVGLAAGAATGPWEGLPLNEAVDTFRRDLIERTLARCEGNWAAAARELGVDRGNLYRMGQRLGLA